MLFKEYLSAMLGDFTVKKAKFPRGSVNNQKFAK